MSPRPLIRRSTRDFFREARAERNVSFIDALHGYVYARWPYRYIGWAMGARPLPRLARPWFRLASRIIDRRTRRASPGASFADGYHGKVVIPDAAAQLVSVDIGLEIRNLEQVIPYATARDIVLRNPDHIVALECPCRANQASPCLPLDVCLIIGEPFASLVIDHHPGRAHWISQGEAETILREEHARGHVHHAFFKDAMLGRFYAICNCCRCCCGAMRASRAGVPMLAPSGYVCCPDASRCTGCGACASRCPFDALTIGPSGVTIDRDACMGCGVCASSCPAGALRLVRDQGKGIPLDLRALLSD